MTNELIMELTTKRDSNGNRYRLNIDLKNQTFERGYYLRQDKPLETTKSDILNSIYLLKQFGYKEMI